MTNNDNVTDNAYAFTVGDATTGRVTVSIGGIPLTMLIDTGATVNVIDKNTWTQLKQSKIKCISSKAGPTKPLFVYGCSEPLKTIGTFKAEVNVGNQACEAEFVVINGIGVPLLGKKTATQLRVVKIETIPEVSSIECSENLPVNDLKRKLMTEFKDVLSGVGKLKSHQIKLKTDPSVKPIAQPVRRTPFGLREKVENQLQELIDADIIEPVE